MAIVQQESLLCPVAALWPLSTAALPLHHAQVVLHSTGNYPDKEHPAKIRIP